MPATVLETNSRSRSRTADSASYREALATNEHRLYQAEPARGVITTMAASVRSSSSDSGSESSRGSSSTPSSGYMQVGLSENTNLAFEKSHTFLNWLLLLVLLGGTSVCAGIFYYAVPLRHELTATVRAHLANTPFKEGDASFLGGWTGGWLSASSFSRAVELRHVNASSFVRPEKAGFTIASGAVTTWADVEAWLLKVFAPTLYTGSLGGAIVVQLAKLHLTKGSLEPNEDSNTRGVAASKLIFDGKAFDSVFDGALVVPLYSPCACTRARLRTRLALAA